MPTLVIEHIAPSAVSDSTILPPFHQIHEAVTDMSVPTVRQQGNVQEIPGTQVVKRIQKQNVEPVPHKRDQRTDGQNARVSFPTARQQRNVKEIPGTQVVERIQKQIFENIPQERDERTVEQNVCVSVPTVQKQVIVQGIPELQVVEQKLEQAVEAMQVKLLERVQQRVDEQSKRIFERLEESDKRFEMIEARRAENNELIKEIVVLWEERKRQEGLSGRFEPTDDDQRYSRESSKKKKNRNLNRTVQVLEQIPEHTVASSDQGSLIGCNTTGGLVDGMMQCSTANIYKSP